MKSKRGSVYQFKDYWVGSVSLGKDQFGKRIRKTVYGKTKAEAEDKLNTLIFNIKTGEYIEPVKDTFVGFLKEYHNVCAGYDMWDIKSHKPKESKWESTTSELYKMYIDAHFEPYFKLMKLLDVKPKELDMFYNYKLSKEVIKNGRKYKMSINTVRKLNAFIRAAFNYGIVNGYIKNNPANHVLLSKKVEFEPMILTEENFKGLLSYVSGTDDEIPIILGGGCGLRRGEIFGLRWKNVDFTNKTISVERTNVRFNKYVDKDPKNETSKRTIIVSENVLSILRMYKIRSKHSQEDDLVIYQWKPGAYSERFGKIVKKFGMEGLRLHDLRHYNATIMMFCNVPDKVAAKRLGHSNTTTLKKTYQHVLDEMDRQAAEKINDSLEKKKSQKAAT